MGKIRFRLKSDKVELLLTQKSIDPMAVSAMTLDRVVLLWKGQACNLEFLAKRAFVQL